MDETLHDLEYKTEGQKPGYSGLLLPWNLPHELVKSIISVLMLTQGPKASQITFLDSNFSSSKMNQLT